MLAADVRRGGAERVGIESGACTRNGGIYVVKMPRCALFPDFCVVVDFQPLNPGLKYPYCT